MKFGGVDCLLMNYVRPKNSQPSKPRRRGSADGRKRIMIGPWALHVLHIILASLFSCLREESTALSERKVTFHSFSCTGK